jgi:hypothetical protein
VLAALSGLRSRRSFIPQEGVAVSSSLERLARNQALFRAVNERIEEIAGDNSKVEFVCECSDTECIETVELRLTDYEEIRANPIRFVIKPGHEIDAIERVISEDGGSAVVEKNKAEGDLIEMDPRAAEAT